MKEVMEDRKESMLKSELNTTTSDTRLKTETDRWGQVRQEVIC